MMQGITSPSRPWPRSAPRVRGHPRGRRRLGPRGVEHRREPHPNHRRDNTMTESTDKSAEMVRFNNEQRDPDMQRRISERTPLETNPGVILDDEDLTVAVGQLLLEHYSDGVTHDGGLCSWGDSCSSTASTCQPPRWRSTCRRCSPPQRMPTTRRARTASDSTKQGPAHPDMGGGTFPLVCPACERHASRSSPRRMPGRTPIGRTATKRASTPSGDGWVKDLPPKTPGRSR